MRATGEAPANEKKGKGGRANFEDKRRSVLSVWSQGPNDEKPVSPYGEQPRYLNLPRAHTVILERWTTRKMVDHAKNSPHRHTASPVLLR